MKPAILIVTPQIGAISETFIHRQVTGLRRLRPVLCVGSQVNANLYPTGVIPVSFRRSSRRRILQKIWARLAARVSKNPWAWSPWETDRLRNVCREYGISVILSHYGPTALGVLPVAEEVGIPLIAHFHGYDASLMLRDPRYALRLKLVFPRFAGVVVPSRFMGEKLAHSGCPRERIAVVSYGVPVPEDIDRALERGTRFLHVGRLVEKKGIEYSLKAFVLAVRELGEATFDIVGEGPLRTAGEALASELGISGLVRFHGALSNDNVQQLMRECNVFVQHSITAANGDTEGLPVSILEAQANGLPVISTRHSGIPEEVIDGTTGFLVDERDVERMAERMVQLGRDATLRSRMGAAGRAHVEANFAVAAQTAKLEEYCLSMVQDIDPA